MNNNLIKGILEAANEEVRDALLDDCQIGSTQNLLTSKWQIKLVKRIAEFVHNLSGWSTRRGNCELIAF